MLKLASLLVAAGSLSLAAQAPAVHLIKAPDASTKPLLGLAAAVRQLPDGKLLVNDIQKRQLLLFDPTLGNVAVIADSVSGANSYGTRPGGIIPYVGDSTLFVDPAGLSMFVIGPAGNIARVASVPRSQDAGFIASNLFGTPGLDAHGRIVYRGGFPRLMPQMGPRGPIGFPEMPDSAALVRIDLATRKLDTAAFFKIPKTKVNVTQTDGRVTVTPEINPMPVIDDWAVLADGSIAIVRGQDYHVDFVHPDGSVSSSSKITFDWQRLSDDDKSAVIDSAKTAMEKARSAGSAIGGLSVAGSPGGGPVIMTFGGGDGGRGNGGRGGNQANIPSFAFVSLNEMPDYRPAFGQGAAKGDADGNLWVRTSATRAGAIAGPIYDVINSKGEVIDHVQLPSGRQIIGFGKGGVVYMQARDDKGAWIERTHR